jgi:hypothetical protein
MGNGTNGEQLISGRRVTTVAKLLISFISQSLRFSDTEAAPHRAAWPGIKYSFGSYSHGSLLHAIVPGIWPKLL